MIAAEHKEHAPVAATVRVGVVTVSDTRTPETDVGGRLVRELTTGAGFTVACHEIVPDDPSVVGGLVARWIDGGAVDAVLLTGGTGLSRRDTTAEAVGGLFDKELPGYGELFRHLSFAEIGAAAMLSRASAGTRGRAVIFTMPGSPGGARLALARLILPELPHIVSELRRHAQHHHHHHQDAGHHHEATAHHDHAGGHDHDHAHSQHSHDHDHHHPFGRHGR
jgi:molybdenum cofactor biosynthesis protein B